MADLPGIDELLAKVVSVGGSDLHLKVGSPPVFRIDGELHLSNLPKLRPEDTEQFAREIMPERARREFEDSHESDFAYGKSQLGRFRVNAFRQRGSVSLVLRTVSPTAASFDALGLPPVLERLASGRRGLVVITGPTGSGKTTTLAAMIDFVNTNQRKSIVTLEDPIEVLHPDKMSVVSQREIGVDTASFGEALRRVLRQDPDVIGIGEMRDRPTVEAALQAAETGHLVLSSMHTSDAGETINRIIDFFPTHQQKQIRLMLAATLQGVVSQRLLPAARGEGRVPAVEVLVRTDRVVKEIANPTDPGVLLGVAQEGEFYGMQSFDQALLKLYQDGLVTFPTALAHASDPVDFKLATRNLGLASA